MVNPGRKSATFLSGSIAVCLIVTKKSIFCVCFCSTSLLPAASTRWFDQHIQSFPHSKKCRRLISATSMNNSSEKFLGTQRIEPRAAGWEALTLPLCCAPHNILDFAIDDEPRHSKGLAVSDESCKATKQNWKNLKNGLDSLLNVSKQLKSIKRFFSFSFEVNGFVPDRKHQIWSSLNLTRQWNEWKQQQQQQQQQRQLRLRQQQQQQRQDPNRWKSH